jgi:hypothetical protein
LFGGGDGFGRIIGVVKGGELDAAPLDLLAFEGGIDAVSHAAPEASGSTLQVHNAADDDFIGRNPDFGRGGAVAGQGQNQCQRETVANPHDAGRNG